VIARTVIFIRLNAIKRRLPLYRKELRSYKNQKVRVSARFVKISRNHFDKDFACFEDCKLIDYNLSVDHFWIQVKQKFNFLYEAKENENFILVGYIRTYKHLEVNKSRLLGVKTYTEAYKLSNIIDIYKEDSND